MILTFNAKSVDSSILEKTLVGRKQMVDEIYNELHEKCINDETYQSLVVAPRGSGKTHLTKVIYSRLKQAEELQDKIVIAYMVEDEYGVFNFTHFCLRVLTAIDRYNEIADANIKAKIIEISELPSKEQLSNITGYLRGIIGTKKLIILVENFDTLLRGMKDDGASLRDFMHEHNIISLVATAQSLTDQFSNSDYPFYNFFKTRHLKKLKFEEAFELIKALIDVEENNVAKEELLKSIAENDEVRSKIRAIYELTSGNHRLLVHFFGFLKADVKSDLSKVFVKQMNDLKSYYEQFVGGLSVLQQRIVQLLSLNHTPLQGKKIAQMSFLEPNVVSKQLSILYKQGFIDKHKEGKNVYYEIKEPLMRICFEINENPEGSAKLFVDFLKIIYDEADRKKHYLKYKLGSKYVEAKMKSTYLSEADIYERTLSKEEKIELKEIEEQLKDCSPKNLGKEIEKILEKHGSTESKNNEKAILYFKSGISYYEKKEYQNAIKAFKKATQLNSKDANAYHYLGNLFGKIGDNKNSITAYEKAVKLNPKNYKSYNNLGVSYNAAGKYKNAIEAYKKAINLHSESDMQYSNIGNSYSNLGEFENSIESYKKAIQLNPKNYNVYNNLGISYDEIGEFENAIEAYKKAIKLNPQNDMAYNNLGNSYGEIGEFIKAIDSYNKAIQLNPKDDEIYCNLGISFFDMEEYKRAIKTLKKAIQINPKNGDVYYNLGISYDEIGEFENAIEVYKKAIQINPQNDMAYNNLGNSYSEIGEFENAIEAYKKAIQLNPNDDEIYCNLGISYFEMEEYKMANKNFKKAIQINPQNDDAYYNLGISYNNLGGFKNAIKAYNKTIQLNPIDDQSLNEIALNYLNQNQLKLAEDSIKKALDLKPKDPFYLGTSIQVKIYQNDWKSSKTILNQIFKEKLEYSSDMIGEDIIEALCKWTPEQLLLDRFGEVGEYFKSKKKTTLLLEGFTFAAFNILIDIENYSKERLGIIQKVFENFAQMSDKVVIPSLMLKVGIDYLKNGSNEAIYDLSKEERQVFDSQVLQKRKYLKK